MQSEVQRQFQTCKQRYGVPDVPEVTIDTITELKDDPTVRLLFVDCREREEYAVSTIPGAILQEDLEMKKIGECTHLIAFCTIGVRSGFFVKTLSLKENVQCKVLNFSGSILAWAAAGLPLVVPETNVPTNVLHTYSSDWDFTDSTITRSVYFSSLKLLYLKARFIAGRFW